jgi:hypothetical protein
VPWPSLFSLWPVQPRFLCLNSRNRCLAACIGCSVIIYARRQPPRCFYLPLSLFLLLVVDKPLTRPAGAASIAPGCTAVA